MEKPVKPVGKRRQARECAIQFLYQFDLGGGEFADSLAAFWHALPEECGADAKKFADDLIRGAVEKRLEIDEKIKKYTEHWELQRIAAVDRNILRLAMYEMLFRDDIPPVVSINEAVDIAKKFSTQESGSFVNGILDRLRADLTRPARTPAGK
ncbi:MAG: transcription antitermination factor NusB [Verrucomicrobiota bacterium]